MCKMKENICNLAVGADGDRVADLDADGLAPVEDLQVHHDHHALRLARHLVAHVLLQFDDRELRDLVVVDEVVELRGEHREAVAVLAVVQQEAEPAQEIHQFDKRFLFINSFLFIFNLAPLGAAAGDGLVAEDLQHRLRHLLPLDTATLEEKFLNLT